MRPERQTQHVGRDVKCRPVQDLSQVVLARVVGSAYSDNQGGRVNIGMCQTRKERMSVLKVSLHQNLRSLEPLVLCPPCLRDLFSVASCHLVTLTVKMVVPVKPLATIVVFVMLPLT